MVAGGYRALLLAALQRASAAQTPLEISYGPNQYLPSVHDPSAFTQLTSPETHWPQLAARSDYFKLFITVLSPKVSTDGELSALISALKNNGIKTGIEIGGARWGSRGCDREAMLNYAKVEQQSVGRWLALGGEINSVSTDHANEWNSRGDKPGDNCDPPVPMTERIDTVAQIFASWRTFLGADASLGFIESLGFWDIDGPDGTAFANMDPVHLNNISGWIPRLDDVTSMLLAKAEKYNPMPSVPLLDHYQIDFGLGGIESDTARYGRAADGGLNYGRIVGAEIVMRKHGLRSEVILNAFPGGTDSGKHCLVSCDRSLEVASHSAVVRTLNFTRGYLALPNRLSERAILEQWQPYPNVTGPETAEDAGMSMALQAAKLIKAAGSSAADAYLV